MFAQNWQQMMECAGCFLLDLPEFGKWEKLYHQISPEFRERFFSSVTAGDVPLAEAKKRFPGSDYYGLLLLAAVANYPEMKALYLRNHYPQQMLQEITGDLHLWLPVLHDELEVYGLNERIFGWTRSCITGVTKQCGRLQFNQFHLFQPRFSFYRHSDGSWIQRPAHDPGNPPDPILSYEDKVINLHIPATGPLKREAVIDSLRQISDFCRKISPDYQFRAIVCYSWLLDTQFRKLLGDNSNIIQFQKLGHCFTIPDHCQTEEVKWRLWGAAGRTEKLENLPRISSMQRKTAEFLLSGGNIEEGGIIIPADKLDTLS